ncbi:MAG: EamA family transporter, partial [Actinobacteria bacterium]|nr:EamA family transporter [Actinomycetota bacterium]
MLVTATLWGLSGTLSKYLMQGGVTPIALGQGRSVVTALLLFAFLALRRPAGLRVPRRAWAWLVLFGVFLATVQFAYFSAIERLAVAAAILLEYLSPALVVAFGWLFQGRRVT